MKARANAFFLALFSRMPRESVVGDGNARRLHCVIGLVLIGFFSAPLQAGPSADKLSRFAGYYTGGPFEVAYVDYFGGRLAVQPPGWSSRPNLARRDATTFEQSLPAPDPKRLVSFNDFVNGEPQEVSLTGFGKSDAPLHLRRVQPGREPPGLLVLEGQARAAVSRLNGAAADQIVEFSLNTLQSRPSHAADISSFLDLYLRSNPAASSARLYFARGLARLITKQRDGAHSDFTAALRLQPDNENAKEYLTLLTVSEPGAGNGYRKLIPLNLDELYSPPTAMEIEAVRRDWASRDLAPRKVEVVDRSSLRCGATDYDVRILKHSSRGFPHYGALLVPQRIRGPMATIIDVRGVDPSFSPMNLDQCTTLLRTLGNEARRLAVLIPSMNGHEMQSHGRSFKSGGDPSESWDGGTDAVLSLLNAALGVEKRLNPGKIAIHGHSRGGGVAMLAGIRDKRISLVLSRSGPVDWFEAMQPIDGISWADSLRLALKDGKPPAPRSRVSQHYDTWIDRVVSDRETLAQTRHRMIASSAYYFAEGLPETHAFYGEDDPAVVPLNAKMLELRLRLAGQLQRGSTVEVYEGVGHDTDWYRSSVVISRALNNWLAR